MDNEEVEVAVVDKTDSDFLYVDNYFAPDPKPRQTANSGDENSDPPKFLGLLIFCFVFCCYCGTFVFCSIKCRVRKSPEGSLTVLDRFGKPALDIELKEQKISRVL